MTRFSLKPPNPRNIGWGIYVVLFCGLCLVPGAAQEPLKTLLVGVDHRSVTSLNGNWHYLVDQPPGRALYSPDGKVRDNGYGLNSHPNINSGPHNEEYDFATAPTLRVPGDWNTQDPTLFRFEGVIWYQRDFDFQPKSNTRTFLHIGAANYKSFIWVNQKRICDHEGGFTPFDCEVTAALKAGSNYVVIAVDSTRQVDGVPSVGIDWFNYGGLTRDVSLVSLPPQFIDDYDVQLKHENAFSAANANTLAGYVHVEGAAA
jgi:beta-glucuronidase